MFEFASSSQFIFYSLIIAAIIVVGLGLATFFSIIYHRFIYPKILRPSYDDNYHPQCSVIIPCKGLPQDFEHNISSFLKFNYEKYEVIYVVESEQDPATPIIRKVVAADARASLVIAGITTSCSQKNFNMIAGLKKAQSPEVYIFADSDINPNKNWLTELIRPLSKEKISVTTGFRWLYSSTGKVGELTNAYQNSVLFILFSIASFIQDVGLWGGTMAIKRKDFEEMGVGDYWAQTVVDDMSLSRLIMKNSKKSVMVSTCVTPTNDALQTIRSSTFWFKRQVMFLKAYQKKLWYIAILLVSTCLFFFLLLPISIILACCTEGSFWQSGGAASLFFIGGTLGSAFLYPFLGKHPNMFRFLLFQPLSLFTLLFGVFMTLFSNSVKWSGFTYKLNFKGIVTSVDQH